MIYTTKQPNRQIRGTYFISLYSKEGIDFTVQDPTGLPLFEKNDKKEALFIFNTSFPGDYQFIFTNKVAT
jgi:hypothetical protein